jgi:hypothetical protein
MMMIRFAILAVVFSCFQFGCAAPGPKPEEELSSAGSIIAIDVNDAAKLDYLQNVKNALKYYHRVVIDIKYYHNKSNFKELFEEIEKYVKTYVDKILFETDTSGNIDLKLETAKIHLVLTSLYFDIGYQMKAVKYLESFYERYHADTYLLEKTLNPRDIGFFSLGQGMKILEQIAHRKVQPEVHGPLYPWKKSSGKNYPWRDPNR